MLVIKNGEKMKTKEYIKSTIISNLPKLKSEYKIKSLKLFGSYVDNSATENSDIDLLVAFDEVIDILQYIKLRNLLSELLNADVDLVMESTLKSRIKSNIMQNAELI